MIDLLLMLLGFAPLIYGAGMLVDSASSLAQKLNVPHIVIGLTIVAFGTSAPEMVVNIFASVAKNSHLTLGNVIGSNVFNILVILGASSLIHPLVVARSTFRFDIPLCLFTAILVYVLANDQWWSHQTLSVLTRLDGVIMLFFFLLFLLYLAYFNYLAQKGGYVAEIFVKERSVSLSILLIIAGLALLMVGGKLIVDSAVRVAQLFGISERVIGLTIVAAGTSLPELATSIIAGRKKNYDIAIGNIVGSNIFNVLFILGVSAVIYPIPVASNAIFDLLFNILISVMLLVAVLAGKKQKITRMAGIVFLITYILYAGFLLI